MSLDFSAMYSQKLEPCRQRIELWRRHQSVFTFETSTLIPFGPVLQLPRSTMHRISYKSNERDNTDLKFGITELAEHQSHFIKRRDSSNPQTQPERSSEAL